MTEELLRSSSNARMRRGHWAPVDSTYVGDLEGVCAARLVVRWVKGPLAQTMSGVFSTGSAGSTWLTCCEGEGPGGDRHKVRGVNQASKFGVEEEEEWAAGSGGGSCAGGRECASSPGDCRSGLTRMLPTSTRPGRLAGGPKGKCLLGHSHGNGLQTYGVLGGPAHLADGHEPDPSDEDGGG